MSTSCHLLQRKNPLEVWLDGRNVGRQHGTGVHYYALNHRSSLENIGISTKWLLENTDNTPPKAAICRFFQALCARPPHIGEDSFQSPWGNRSPSARSLPSRPYPLSLSQKNTKTKSQGPPRYHALDISSAYPSPRMPEHRNCTRLDPSNKPRANNYQFSSFPLSYARSHRP